MTAYRSGVEEGVLKGLVALEQLAAQEGGIPDILEQGDVHRRVRQVRQREGLDGGHFGVVGGSEAGSGQGRGARAGRIAAQRAARR